MTKPNDGGPAFPVVETDPVLGSRACPGMTLRDWFAGQALRIAFDDRGHNATLNDIARDAYDYADAMLRARETRSDVTES